MSTEAKYLSRPGGAGRLRPRRAAHRRGAGGARHPLRGGRAEPRAGREAARRGHGGRLRATRPSPAVLIQAHIARARVLVVATPDAINVRQMIETARTLNPAIETVIRSHNEEEARLLTQEAAATVFLGEHELAQAMARAVLSAPRRPERLLRGLRSPACGSAARSSRAPCARTSIRRSAAASSLVLTSRPVWPSRASLV